MAVYIIQIITLILVLISTLILILKEWDFIKKILMRIKLRINYLFWSKEAKEKSKMLIKQYQLPKDTIGVKGIVFSKEVKTTRRTKE